MWHFFDEHDNEMRCFVPLPMLPVGDMSVFCRRFETKYIHVTNCDKLLLLWNILAVFFEESLMVVLSHKIYEIEAGSYSDLSFAVCMKSRICTMFARHLSYEWFKVNRSNGTMLLNKMLVREGVQDVITQVSQCVLLVEAGCFTCRELLERECNLLDNDPNIMEYTNYNDIYFSSYFTS